MRISRLTLQFTLALFTLALFLGGQTVATAYQNQPKEKQEENRLVRLATTTSTDNSGLLDYLLPQFEKESGYSIQVLSVGTGKALRLGENGDVDVLLVHAPDSEQQFMQLGHGSIRKRVMINDFVVVGPKNDPAGLLQARTAEDAFKRLHRNESPFISRGDDSGTHKKELSLWEKSGITGAGSGSGSAHEWGEWRLEIGQGMGKSLQIADELQAYILIDRSTWMSLQHKTSLRVLYWGGKVMRNPYHAIAVNPQRHPINFAGSIAFINWITSPAGQTAISNYMINGMQVFLPDAQPTNNHSADQGS